MCVWIVSFLCVKDVFVCPTHYILSIFCLLFVLVDKFEIFLKEDETTTTTICLRDLILERMLVLHSKANRKNRSAIQSGGNKTKNIHTELNCVKGCDIYQTRRHTLSHIDCITSSSLREWDMYLNGLNLRRCPPCLKAKNIFRK